MSKNHFSGPAISFRERRLPKRATLAGYSALIDFYDLHVPLPRMLSATGDRHRTIHTPAWRILTPCYAPSSNLDGHLAFALKYEGLDMAVFKHVFLASGPKPIEALVHRRPTGSYARRIWFLYEWLLGNQLDLPDAQGGRYIPVVNPALQVCVPGRTSPRHKVKNNLPGTSQFCPLVFITEKIQGLIDLNLKHKAQEIIQHVPKDILSRCAAFLLLKGSRASHVIEGEGPAHSRIQRWAHVLGEAGLRPLDEEELLKLHESLIGDFRFV